MAGTTPNWLFLLLLFTLPFEFTLTALLLLYSEEDHTLAPLAQDPDFTPSGTLPRPKAVREHLYLFRGRSVPGV